MKKDEGLQSIAEIFGKKETKKAPAYQWQDLALTIIEKLEIPVFKKNSVFLVCKKYPREFIEKCMNDTLELCKDGEKWKYFFKLIAK